MHLKEAWSLYLDHFLSIILIGATIVFPLELVSFTFSSFNYAVFGVMGLSVLTGVIIKIFILNLAQIPFIRLASRAAVNQKASIGSIYFTFVMYLVPVFIMNVYYLICVLVGSVLLILPGIFFLILTCMFPYVAVIDQKKGMALFKRTYWIGRSQSLDMGIIMFIFICTYVFIWSLTTNAIGWFHTNFLTFVLLHLAINSLLVPYFVFVVVLNYFEWSEKSRDRLEELEMNDYGREVL